MYVAAVRVHDDLCVERRSTNKTRYEYHKCDLLPADFARTVNGRVSGIYLKETYSTLNEYAYGASKI